MGSPATLQTDELAHAAMAATFHHLSNWHFTASAVTDTSVCNCRNRNRLHGVVPVTLWHNLCST